MNLTVASLIQNSGRLLATLEKAGEGLNPSEQTEALGYLNMMLDSWNIMRNSVYAVVEYIIPLTAGVQSYAIGLNATAPWNVPRPNFITNANIIYQSSPTIVRLPLEMISVDQWAQIRVPQLFALPTKLYYDRGYSQSSPTGNATLNFWPGPDNSETYEVDLFCTTNLPTTLTLEDTIYVPDGYGRAIQFNLAVEMMPLFPEGVNAAQEARVLRIAAESKRYVSNLNSPTLRMQVDPALRPSSDDSAFNWKIDNTVL